MELHETAVQVDGCAVLKTALPGRQALSIMPGMGFCWRSQAQSPQSALRALRRLACAADPETAGK